MSGEEDYADKMLAMQPRELVAEMARQAAYPWRVEIARAVLEAKAAEALRRATVALAAVTAALVAVTVVLVVVTAQAD